MNKFAVVTYIVGLWPEFLGRQGSPGFLWIAAAAARHSLSRGRPKQFRLDFLAFIWIKFALRLKA
jgi:hypothetical protein